MLKFCQLEFLPDNNVNAFYTLLVSKKHVRVLRYLQWYLKHIFIIVEVHANKINKCKTTRPQSNVDISCEQNWKIYTALPARTCKILQECHDRAPEMNGIRRIHRIHRIHGIHGSWKLRSRWSWELWSPWAAGRFENVCLAQCHTDAGWGHASAWGSAKAGGCNRLQFQWVGAFCSGAFCLFMFD